MNLRDGRALTAPTDDIDTRLTEEQRAACRRVIAAHAVGNNLKEMVADAEEMMRYLGVHPSQRDEAAYSLSDPARVNWT